MKAYASSTIVENRAGAGGRVVMDALKNSAADGSVMVLTPAVAMCLYPHVYKSLSYNPQQDFAPVTTILTTSMLFVVGPLVPSSVKTLADFIAWCRSNPNQASYRSPGAGSPLHFLGVMLFRAADFEYSTSLQGTAPAIQSLLGRSNRLLHLADRPLRAAYPGRAAAGAGDDGRTASVLPDCQPLPRRDTQRSNSPKGRYFSSSADDQRDRRDAEQRLAYRAADQGNAGRACQSIGGCRRPHTRRVCPPDQGRLRPLGADREGIRVHPSD